MARSKIDGVIEAVRYDADGKIILVRGYVRRGATYSDRVLLNRETLLERLRQGQHIVTGQRKEFWASTFEVDKLVERLAFNNKEFITTDGQSGRDTLENTPIF